MSLYKQKDPQDDRRFQFLTDQHGRRWGCTIEIASGDPTGPIDLYDTAGNVTTAPVMPPPSHMKVDSRRDYGTLKIDYHGWRTERQRAWDDYERRMLGIATAMYKDDAALKVQDPPPALVTAVGIPPQPVGPILLAERGDPWMLGLTDDRPSWADSPNRPGWVDALFHERKVSRKAPDELAWMDDEPTSESEFPVMYGPGRWRLSDGSTMQGKKVDAVAAEAALSPHESWE